MEPSLQAFLDEHRLPRDYLHWVERYFEPLSRELLRMRQASERTLWIGINGSQGSGKSTLASLLVYLLNQRGANCIQLSIDDFYLSRANRADLAHQIHPLLATRGVPGTHNMSLLRSTLEGLSKAGPALAVPRFDKASDDPLPETDWPRAHPPLDLVLLEGWCVGVTAQPDAALIDPINRLEAEEDAQGVWRRHVNQQTRLFYEPLWRDLDLLIMLRAPNFDCVAAWRGEQEQKLRDRLGDDAAVSRVMDETQLARFIQHYQRLTEHALHTLPERCHYLYQLDEGRNILALEQPLEWQP